jgi:hypothetical protein
MKKLTLFLSCICLPLSITAQVDSSTMNGKFLMGYQGWRACTGDGSAVNSYLHWSYNGAQPAQGNVIPDIWPDNSELTAGEQFSTSLTMGNGQQAKAYSSYLPQTVNRHFQWMQANNLDGVFLQRFIWDVKGSGNPSMTALRNQVALNVKSAAESNGRVFALMYDLSGEPPAQMVSDMQSDWAYVTGTLQLTNSSRYLKHNGKPVVAIWGIGFSGFTFTTTQITTLINYFKSQGCTVMGGVPYSWRTLDGDSQTSTAWTPIYHSLDVLSPWSVNRYQTESQVDANLPRLQADLADCQANGVDYLPVAFPGYSAKNLNGGALNEAPRNGGNFYWRQVYNVLRSGCNMVYGAMFDEVDEGTALYKLAPTMQTTPTPGASSFFALNVDGYTLPSDWYLRVTGQGTKSVNGTIPLHTQLPITPTNSITVTYPNGGQVLQAGNPLTVTWTSIGTVGNVNIDVSSDGGASFRALVYNTPNTGSKTVTIPYYGNTTCYIRVQRTNGVPVDWSDNKFTIQTGVINPATHLTKKWTLAPGDRPYLSNSGTSERGIGYDSTADKLFIVHREGSTPFVYVLNGNTGADLNTLNTTGITGGGFVLDKIGVADNGVIYAGNVSTPNSSTFPTFKLYRWANANAGTVPTLAYSGAAGFGKGIRVGDTMTVRGSGVGTQILVGGRGTNGVSILTTTDGVNFTAKVLTTTLNKADLGAGLAFGSGTTYWVKTNSRSLFRLSYNFAAGTSTTLNTFGNLPPDFSAFAVDAANDLIADIDVIDGRDQLNLYDISNLAATPVLLHSFTFPQDNDNAMGLGAVVFGSNDRCYAINANNGVIACSVDRKAVITTEPQGQTVNQGANATFTVAATGSALSYQWKKNGANISGATTTALTLSNVQSSDAATYTVEASNTFSTDTSANAVLTVTVPPSISTQPANRSNNYGTTAAFTVSATGTSLNYQWQKNGANLANGGNVSGATTATLTLTSITQNDEANYRVIVSNTAGSVTSSVATLTVVQPIITTQPQDVAVVAGTSANFTVGATGAAPLSYQWRKNGGNISGATTSFFTIASAQSADAGNYSVVVSNPYGSATSSTATLTITVPPTITTQPASRTNNAGTTATFTVAANGGALSYQWRKDGANLSNGGKISGATTATLAVSMVTLDEEGSYSVVVANTAGSITSSAATLTVLYPLPYYEPFAYTAGANLGGQINDDWLTWSDIGTATAGPYITIQTGNLSVSGLAPSTGNRIQFGGLGKSARFSFATGTAITSGTMHYSFALNVTNLTGLTTSGTFIAGFNNSIGTQTGQPTAVGTRVYLRSSGSGYQIGLSKNSSTSTEWVWNTTVRSVNQTVFLVGSYTFTTVGNSTDDVAKLWINPSSTTFGGTAPAATLTATAGNDLTSDQIYSFVFLQRSANEPAGMLADELRLGRTWADVTPTTAQPLSNLSPEFSAMQSSSTQFSVSLSVQPGVTYAIEYSTDFSTWTELTNFVASESVFQFTDNTPEAQRFYRAIRR